MIAATSMTLVTQHQRLAALRPLSPESVTSIAAAWDVRMVHESNAIEGNSLTLRETEMVLSKGVTISGKPLKDHVEALNLAVAWERVKQLASTGNKLSESDLLELHRIILTRVEDNHAGHYRSGAVRISGSNHLPPNPIKVSDLMEALFNELKAMPDAIEKAAMNFVLIAAVYPPVSISTDRRADYYKALEAADSGHFETWLDFINRLVEEELDRWLNTLEDAKPDKHGS